MDFAKAGSVHKYRILAYRRLPLTHPMTIFRDAGEVLRVAPSVDRSGSEIGRVDLIYHALSVLSSLPLSRTTSTMKTLQWYSSWNPSIKSRCVREPIRKLEYAQKAQIALDRSGLKVAGNDNYHKSP